MRIIPRAVLPFAIRGFLPFRRSGRWSILQLVSVAASILCGAPAYAAVQNTVTTLTVTVPGSTAPHAATLVATVTANGKPLQRGTVTFCDANTRPCIDLAVLGTASVTGSGTATLKKVFAPGVHRAYAFFNRTVTDSRSESMIETVNVPGDVATTAAIAKASRGSTVAVQARVSAVTAAPLAGTASLVQDDSRRVLGSSTLTRAAISASFGQPTSVDSLPQPPSGVAGLGSTAIGDFNADGLPDFAIGLSASPDDSIGILLNDPDHPGHFLPGGTIPGLGGTAVILTGDFNGDGVLDLVWQSYFPNSSSRPLSIAFGDPTQPGQFLTPIRVGSFPYLFAAADLNGDGLPDLVGNTENVDGILVLFNDPKHPGQFTNSYTFSRTSSIYRFGAPAIADMNGDGFPDIVFEAGDPEDFMPGTMNVLLNDPGNPGHFLEPISNSAGSYVLQPTSLPPVVADLNHDGLPDVAVKSLSPGANYADAKWVVTIFLNNPAAEGHLLPPYAIHVPNPNNVGLAAGNFKGLRNLDLVTDDGNILPADPAHPGQFLAPEALPDPVDGFGQPYLYMLSPADLNADGYADLIAATPYATQYVPLTLDIILTQVTQSSTASFPSFALSGTHPELAHIEYEGNDDFSPSTSCSIDLSVVIPQRPSVTNVKALSTGPASETITYTASGAQDTLSYGPAGSSFVTVQAPAPGSPFVLEGLSPGTTYYYLITSTTYASGCTPLTANSSFNTFATAPALP